MEEKLGRAHNDVSFIASFPAHKGMEKKDLQK
jgi:hypothetical protein